MVTGCACFFSELPPWRLVDSLLNDRGRGQRYGGLELK